MKLWKYFAVLIGILIFSLGCAPTQQIVQGTGAGEITAKKITSTELKIYPDKSTGKRYDQYSAIVLIGRIVTMDDGDSGKIGIIDSGKVVIVGEKIDTVLLKGQKFPPDLDSTGALFLNTGGIIFPGLINAHDHIHYNLAGIWNAPKKYTDRYQWPSDRSLRADVKYAKYITQDRKYFGIQAEAIKYAEVKQLISGTTAVQGSPNGSKKFCDILVRNMDVSPNFGFKRMSPYVRDVTKVDDDKIRRWLDKMNEGKLDALFFHIAEGTDDIARNEFDFLVEHGLGRKETIIIHGTALDEEQIRYMADHNMSVIWSPTSNLLLYGETADIPTYYQYGVNICLGTDWSPSGGKNLLDELKIAYEYNKAKFGGILSYEDMARMVTCNPADAVGWKNYCGRIKPSLYADIMVIGDNEPNPFKALVDATERDVELVFIGGDPLYGDSTFMVKLKPGDFEYIKTPCGFTKCLDFTKDDVQFGNQTFEYVVSLLQKALSFDPDYMEQKFHDKRIQKYDTFEDYLDAKFPGYHPIQLDPIYACMDTYFFDALRTSKNANLTFDIQKIYYSWVPDSVLGN